MTLDPTKIPVPVEGDWLGVRRAIQVIRQFVGEVSDAAGETTDFAKLASAFNVFMQSQTVYPAILHSSSGVVNWDLNESQNAELTTTENVTAVNVSNGYAGRFLSLRISSGGSHTITWGDSFKNVSGFVMPSPDYVTVASFRCRSSGVVEFIGQSAEFSEWAFEDKTNVALRELAISAAGYITRKSTASASLHSLAVTGLLIPLPPGSGYVTLSNIKSSMSGSIGRNSTSFVTMKPISVSGIVTVNTRGSIAITLTKLLTSGSGKLQRKGSEASSIQKIVASGVASVSVNMLLESGDDLLLENGNNLFLE